jgi:FixJ family two-component response regulator
MLDVRMPEMGGLEVQQRLREAGIGLPIIFIAAHGDVPTCAQAFKAGASEFLEKPLDHATLLDHIRKALARGAEQKLQGEFAARASQLTPSEKEVLELLISGKSLKEIANVRNVTVQTIWKHRLNLLQKMGVESDLELVRAATQWASQRRQ